MTKKNSASQLPILNGEHVTFVWRGEQAPCLIGDFNGWDPDQGLPLKRVRPRRWELTLRFPRNAYVEYAYLMDGKRVPDPGNSRTVYNGMDSVNHYFYMPEGRPTPLAERRRGIPAGKVTHRMVESEYNLVGGRRAVYFYRPPVPEPCPLIVVLDGPDYRKRAGLTHMVDNLIATRHIRPVALALVANAGRARGVEYACNDATVNFIVEDVLPAASEELNLVNVNQSQGAYGILGASMGGLMALYTAIRRPEVFGRVISQSGAFEASSVILDLIRLSELKPVVTWMDVGIYDPLYQENQEMAALLKSKGYPVIYQEYNGGHSYTAWRDDVWRGLEIVFGIE